MKELKEGKITYKALAEWFGIEYSTFKSHSKEKKLKILKGFADYHYEGRSIYIDKVYISTYNKDYDTIKKGFLNSWHKSKIDTCARVGRDIYFHNKGL